MIFSASKQTYFGSGPKCRIGSNVFLLWDVPSCGKRLCHFKLQHVVSSSEYAQKRPCGGKAPRSLERCIASAVPVCFFLVKPGNVASNPVLLKNCCNKMSTRNIVDHLICECMQASVARPRTPGANSYTRENTCNMSLLSKSMTNQKLYHCIPEHCARSVMRPTWRNVAFL